MITQGPAKTTTAPRSDPAHRETLSSCPLCAAATDGAFCRSSRHSGDGTIMTPGREAMKIILLVAAMALTLGIGSACQPISTYVASHKTTYVFPRGGGGGGGNGG